MHNMECFVQRLLRRRNRRRTSHRGFLLDTNRFAAVGASRSLLAQRHRDTSEGKVAEQHTNTNTSRRMDGSRLTTINAGIEKGESRTPKSIKPVFSVRALTGQRHGNGHPTHPEVALCEREVGLVRSNDLRNAVQKPVSISGTREQVVRTPPQVLLDSKPAGLNRCHWHRIDTSTRSVRKETERRRAANSRVETHAKLTNQSPTAWSRSLPRCRDNSKKDLDSFQGLRSHIAERLQWIHLHADASVCNRFGFGGQHLIRANCQHEHHVGTTTSSMQGIGEARTRHPSTSRGCRFAASSPRNHHNASD